MVKKAGNSNTLRIIGGQYRGRKLSFPDAKGLRPTADRIRETLFNWLQNDINNSRCLDLFAGSGALGFEAASRGAGYVGMVESASVVSSQLRKNIALLGLDSVIDVFQAKALTWIEGQTEKPFDIIFLDPPFAENYLNEIIQSLAFNKCLADRALIYIERDIKQLLPEFPEGWNLIKDKKAGQVAYSLVSYCR